MMDRIRVLVELLRHPKGKQQIDIDEVDRRVFLDRRRGGDLDELVHVMLTIGPSPLHHHGTDVLDRLHHRCHVAQR